jgi:DNA-binding transcriptional MerR regulator
MELLFKQLGFNPADIKKQVDEAASNFQAVVDHFEGRFTQLEAKVDEVLKLLNQTNEGNKNV